MSVASGVLDSYRDRRVVVLGASGFIGSHLVVRLLECGARVVAFSRRPATAISTLARAQVVAGDILSAADCRAVLRSDDIVFHLAGRSGAAASLADPVESLTVNGAGMLTLLETARVLDRMPRIVFAGSRLEYGIAQQVPVTEDHPLLPTSLYGLHKVLCEEYLAFYARHFGLSYAVARLTNPYGPGAAGVAQPYNVLGTMIVRALSGETLTVYGDGAQLRDYIYIDDTIDALLLLGSIATNTVVNIGSGIGITFREAVARIAAVTEQPVVSIPWPPAESAVETGDFVADIGRARSLGFDPHTSFDQGLAKTIAALR